MLANPYLRESQKRNREESKDKPTYADTQKHK
jgi:hypothetical protein